MHNIRLIHIFYGLNLGVPLQHRNLTFCYFKIVLRWPEIRISSLSGGGDLVVLVLAFIRLLSIM